MSKQYRPCQKRQEKGQLETENSTETMKECDRVKRGNFVVLRKNMFTCSQPVLYVVYRKILQLASQLITKERKSNGMIDRSFMSL